LKCLKIRGFELSLILKFQEFLWGEENAIESRFEIESASWGFEAIDINSQAFDF
jgi:hypothetical protein